MTRFIAGEPVAESFILDDAATGETFTITNAIGPGGSWDGPDVSEAGGGVYQATGSQAGTETEVGLYQATLRGDSTRQARTVQWEIVDAPAPAFTRRVTGHVIAANDINELQQGLEKVEKVLGLD